MESPSSRATAGPSVGRGEPTGRRGDGPPAPTGAAPRRRPRLPESLTWSRRLDPADAAWEAERGRRTLVAGILAFRWAALAWMVVLAITAESLRRPGLAIVAVAVTALWTLWLTVFPGYRHPAVGWLDLGVALGLILVSGVVINEAGFLGDAPFFATAYPVSAILMWGLTRGMVGGLAAGAVAGVALVASRSANSVALAELSVGQIQALATSIVIFLIGGGTLGLVARLLDRSAIQVRAATEAALEARERAARLAEREALARRIHDSVLQALTLIQKRGRELEEQEAVTGREVGRLARMAADQERALRALVVRQDEDRPVGMASLREVVEGAVRGIRDVPVEISGRGAVWLPADRAGELGAAVRQALDNVERHAEATKVTIHLDAEDGWASVSVHDDGRGFRFDEEALRAAGKLGMLASMKGRVEELGGEMRVDTAPGAGTEVELRIPREAPL